jgi:hypothetical protein
MYTGLIRRYTLFVNSEEFKNINRLFLRIAGAKLAAFTDGDLSVREPDPKAHQ